MSTETKKQRLQRRAREAKAIDEAVRRLWKRAFKIPSFTGKARFLDSIRPLMNKTLLLADNLKVDASEE